MKPTKKGDRQLVAPKDTLMPLEGKMITKVQSIVGALLYYARAIDNTILTALNEISAMQANPTENTMKQCKHLLDYVATYPNVKLRYHASDMQLHVDSDAAYLVAPKARSRIAGYYNFPNRLYKSTILPDINHPILIECKTLRHVVTSAAEAETAALFHNAQTILPLRRILRSLGHEQKPTRIKTDNSVANGFVHNNIHLRRSKTWDMRYYSLKDNEEKGNINVYWKQGKDEKDPNRGDYHTKRHNAIHHQGVRNTYVFDG